MIGDPDKPTIPEVVPLILEYYALPGNNVGGALHLVLEDGNSDVNSIDFSIQWAIEHNDTRGALLCKILKRMSGTQRGKLAHMNFDKRNY